MTKPWRPGTVTNVAFSRKRSRSPGGFDRKRSRWSSARPLGLSSVGAVLAAAVCVGLSVGIGIIPGPPVLSAAEAPAGAIPFFGTCHYGGGTNCVVDGDTFYFAGDKVRIANIDAPETHPPRCADEARLGDAATERLRELLNSGPVTLSAIDRDEDVYGRKLRNVAVGGADVGETLVGAGVARFYGSGRRSWCG